MVGSGYLRHNVVRYGTRRSHAVGDFIRDCDPERFFEPDDKFNGFESHKQVLAVEQ
jgi:hypothetical protein